MMSEVVAKVEQAYRAKAPSGEALPSFGLGMSEAKKFKAPPSIVFVPDQGTIARPRTRGEGDALATRTTAIDLRVWGEDVDDCEDLMAHIAEACKDAYGDAIDLVSETWDTSGTTQNGELVLLRIHLKSDLTPRPSSQTTAPVDTAPITSHVDELEIGT